MHLLFVVDGAALGGVGARRGIERHSSAGKQECCLDKFARALETRRSAGGKRAGGRQITFSESARSNRA